MSYIKKFNPYDLPEETLRAIATGRERVLEEILSVIKGNADGGRVQHLQVVAPRGYGKSFLMRMVQSALRARVAEGLPAILALLPEEQHNVDTPHRLLNEIQRSLEGRPAGSLLGGAFTESAGAWEQAVAALDAFIATKLPAGRGIAVAIVENFDQLIRDVFRGPRDQSRLRALLDRQGGRLMLLATATRRADAAYEQRLFHATRLIELEPWQEETCLALFERLRSHRQAGVMSPQTQAKARALAQFIGGSPRMATVLAEVLDNNDSLRIAQMLDALVDELTPYYKHRIESLPRRSRTLLDALLRMGEPRTQSEIATRLGTTQARIAEPFNELRAGGEVVGVKAQHSAEMLYRVSDRLLAHYYRKRHLGSGEGTSLLEGIVEFLESFYTPEEKHAEAERLRVLGRMADAAVFERLALASKAPPGSGLPNLAPGAGWLDELSTRLAALANAGQLDEALVQCEQAVKRAEASGTRQELALSQRFLGGTLVQLGRHEEAEKELRRALAMAEKADDLREQAWASYLLGWTLSEMNRYAEAEETLRRALALATEVGDASSIAWTELTLLSMAQAIGNDAQVIMAWQRMNAAVAAAPAKSSLPDMDLWLAAAVAAALRSEWFGTFWSMSASLPVKEWKLDRTQRKFAETIATASQTQGRAVAYALAAHGIEVLAQNAVVRATRDDLVGPEPIAFLRGILHRLARQLTDPALLRDIAALLEQRLPSETLAERALLEAAARRAENPDDPAALERVDPDIATVLERMLGANPQPASKTPPRRGKRSGGARRKK